MVHLPTYPTRLVLMIDEQVMLQIDMLVARLEADGYPIDFILDELTEYLEIADELSGD